MAKTDYKLILGTQNWSSWSLRAWLMLRQCHVPFETEMIQLRQPDSKEKINALCPSGLVPCLYHGDLAIADSLAIGEYLAEQFPQTRLWPTNSAARAIARSVSAEMHSGFAPMRSTMPMDVFARMSGFHPDGTVSRNIQRITTIWNDCRQRFGQDGDFLFGDWSLADAMYAPVVSRFLTYGIKVDAVADEYMQAVWAHHDMVAWCLECEKELAQL